MRGRLRAVECPIDAKVFNNLTLLFLPLIILTHEAILSHQVVLRSLGVEIKIIQPQRELLYDVSIMHAEILKVLASIKQQPELGSCLQVNIHWRY